uniref:Putative secreted protein n=1 Tax=Anopheles darlingi TaxID=43151 RepID=A0A2M4D3E8_ANODA
MFHLHLAGAAICYLFRNSLASNTTPQPCSTVLSRLLPWLFKIMFVIASPAVCKEKGDAFSTAAVAMR